MKRSYIIAGLIFMLVLRPGSIGRAQIATRFDLSSPEPSPTPRSNVVNDMLIGSDAVWVGGGKGLSVTADGGRTWRNYGNTATFDEKGISAIAARNLHLWVATAFTQKKDGESIQTGGGLHVSSDGGRTWRFLPQPVDSGTVDTLTYGRNRIAALAVTVPENNVTFDIALTSGTVWIASFAGMLRKSTNDGKTWERVILPPDGPISGIKPTDSLDFDLSPSSGALRLRENLNHRVFSVYASDDSTLWVGTAGGINKTTDGGISWLKFNHQNQAQPISGNFVVAIAEQRWGTRRVIWAATINATDPNERRGVSFSGDGGETWTTTLLGEFAHNFAFKDSIAYVAADGGLYRSADLGKTWTRSGTIYDPGTLQRFGSSAAYAVGVKGDTVWLGGPEGLAYTIDSASEPFGRNWKIFRTYHPVTGTGRTYSYPLPFSPDDEVVRIHYSTEGRSARVSIRIFDFAMQPVRTLLRDALRPGSVEHDEIWNGTDDYNRRAANGVYFYKVEIEGMEPQWGKIFLLQ